jgi:hypothetical protein
LQQWQGQVAFNLHAAPINNGTVYPTLQPKQTAERVVEDMTVTNINDTKE